MIIRPPLPLLQLLAQVSWLQLCCSVSLAWPLLTGLRLQSETLQLLSWASPEGTGLSERGRAVLCWREQLLHQRAKGWQPESHQLRPRWS